MCKMINLLDLKTQKIVKKGHRLRLCPSKNAKAFLLVHHHTSRTFLVYKVRFAKFQVDFVKKKAYGMAGIRYN